MVHKKNVSYVTVNAKDNASERKESLLIISRAQLILCKDNASERKESLLFISRAQLILCKDNARRVQQQGGKTKFYRT